MDEFRNDKRDEYRSKRQKTIDSLGGTDSLQYATLLKLQQEWSRPLQLNATRLFLPRLPAMPDPNEDPPVGRDPPVVSARRYGKRGCPGKPKLCRNCGMPKVGHPKKGCPVK